MPRRKHQHKQSTTSRAVTAPSMPAPVMERRIERLLFTRREAAELLGCSTASLIRLENSGALKAVKLNKAKRSSATYYAAADVYLLAR
jgi:hypothetical protein